jgi:RNA recognition motif-containing protein
MNIYVGNLALEVSEEQLREAFAAFGEVASVKIIRDGTTGESRGFGFVGMPSETEAQAAVTEMNGKEFQGQALSVEPGRTRTVSPGFRSRRPGGGQHRGQRGRPGGRGGDRRGGNRPRGRY